MSDCTGDGPSGEPDWERPVTATRECPACGRLVNAFVNGDRCPNCHAATFADDGAER